MTRVHVICLFTVYFPKFTDFDFCCGVNFVKIFNLGMFISVVQLVHTFVNDIESDSLRSGIGF